MGRIATFLYGLVCYLMFLGVFLYAIGFIGNFGVPKSLDSAPRLTPARAVVVNLLALAVFAIQHSVMARPSFKRWWTRFVPQPVERSTYVLFTNLAMIFMFWVWEPIGGVIWDVGNGVERTLVYALFGLGWSIVLVATILLNHFELFGMRQVTLALRGRPYTPLPFSEPSLYRFVRHPLYVGWLIVFWAAPVMTVAHLLFAVGTTAYILIAIQLEERNLMEALPGYSEYRSRVPMLLPRLSKMDGSS